jgi:hypothetical protein
MWDLTKMLYDRCLSSCLGSSSPDFCASVPCSCAYNFLLQHHLCFNTLPFCLCFSSMLLLFQLYPFIFSSPSHQFRIVFHDKSSSVSMQFMQVLLNGSFRESVSLHSREMNAKTAIAWPIPQLNVFYRLRIMLLA